MAIVGHVNADGTDVDEAPGFGTAYPYASVATNAQFSVESYGAVGNGTTDDTTAINAAVAAALAYAQANGSYAEVVFKAKTYLVNGALTQGGATKGNALIPLPLIAPTAHKVTLAFKGAGDATALPHWQQTVNQRTGTVLRTTVAGTQDATYGEASVIGGPTPAQGYGHTASLFDNLYVVVDGLTIVVPNDPHMCGLDLRGVAECNVVNAAVFADSIPGSYTAPTQGWQFGLAMPENNNNDLCQIGLYSCEGVNFGVVTSEHTVAHSIRAVYCVAAVEHGGGGTGHGAVINYLSAEACQVGIGSVGGAFPQKIKINLFDYEKSGAAGFGEFARINDSGNALLGEVWHTSANPHITDGTVNGATNLRIIDLDRQTGLVAAPAVPATTVALRNPFYRDAAVTIAGGTVSAIKIDGATIGLTTGTFFVPTGKTIEIDYTVAPSWVWILL